MVECTYCGSPANSLDHIIPVSYEFVSRKAANYSRKITVPCCEECNNKLSNNWLPTIAERAEHLSEAYRKKYKKILKSPHWEQWEIENLSGFLRKNVESNMILKENIKNRIEHLDEISKEKDLTIDEVWMKYSSDTYKKFY